MLSIIKYQELADRLEKNGEVKFADEDVLIHAYISMNDGYAVDVYDIDEFDFDDADNEPSDGGLCTGEALDAVQFYGENLTGIALESNENYEIIARENKCFAEFISSLGYTQDQISEIAHTGFIADESVQVLLESDNGFAYGFELIAEATKERL